MKVKVISRSTDEFTRERSNDLQRVFRNFDPSLRTLRNAAKLDKIFARRFVGAMDGHIDSVSCMAKNPNHLKGIFSGSMDGDMTRKLNEAKCVHKDHVSAVMDINYSPTGCEFVTGSYDRTIRTYQHNGGHNREIYHTKRMQRAFCIKFSCDGNYVISGSDDTNLRLWKAKVSEQMGVLLPRERKNHEYREAVKNRYKHLLEVKRIVRNRHLPKPIFKASTLRPIMGEAERREDERRRAHSAPGRMPKESIQKKRIVKKVE